jgi:predicted P-loop ATPase
MHDVAVLRIAAEDVRDNFTECFREYSLVNVLDSVVDVFLGSGNSTLHIPLVAHNGFLF